MRSTLLAAALVAAASAGARAQDTGDPRWTAWLGCWDPVIEQGPAWVRTEAPRVCILPAAAGVALITLHRDSVVALQRLDGSGERHAFERDGCTGWERGTFSAEGTRMYLRAEATCPGAARARVATALMSITPRGEWLDVQGVGAGSRTTVRVTRYQAVSEGALVPDSIARLLGGRALAVSTARAAAGERVRIADVIEASREVGGDVTEAWVAEAGDGFELDGRAMVRLADAGVPGNVTDVMVALSHPRTFAVREGRGGGAAPERDERVGSGTAFGYPGEMTPYGWGYYGGYGAFSPYDRYGYGRYGYGYGFGYPYGPGGYGGFGYYPPIIVVVGGSSGGSSQQSGRVVNGRGYQAGRGAPSTNVARPSSGSGGTGGASASSGRDTGGSSGGATATSGGYGSGGSGGSGETGRTAKPRP